MTRAGPRCLVDALENYDRYLPGGLLLILGKNRHLCGLAIEQPLALLTGRHRRPDPKAFAAQFDRRPGLRNEVVRRRWILGASRDRGEHEKAIVICGVHD